MDESMSMDARGSAAQAGLGAVVIERMELPPPPLGDYPIALGLVVFGLFHCLFGAFMAVTQKVSEGLFYAFLGLPFLAPGLLILSRRAALRCALTVHERGLAISRKGADLALPYDQVRDFSLTQRKLFRYSRYRTEGPPVAMARWLEFAREGETLRVYSRSPLHPRDVFAPVVEQVTLRLAQAAKARVDTGEPLQGKGWTLTSRGLEVNGQEAVHLSEVVNAELIDDKRLSFFRRGQPEPFFSIPADSLNAWLLERRVRG